MTSGTLAIRLPRAIALLIPRRGATFGPLVFLRQDLAPEVREHRIMVRLMRAWSEALRAIDLRTWREAKLRAEAAIEIEDMMAGDLPTQSPSVAAARLFGDDVVQQRCRDRQ